MPVHLGLIPAVAIAPLQPQLWATAGPVLQWIQVLCWHILHSYSHCDRQGEFLAPSFQPPYTVLPGCCTAGEALPVGVLCVLQARGAARSLAGLSAQVLLLHLLLRRCSKAPSRGADGAWARRPEPAGAVQEFPVARSPGAHLVAAARPPPALRVGRGCGRARLGFGAAPLWKWWDLISGWLESRLGRAPEDTRCYFQGLCSICSSCSR